MCLAMPHAGWALVHRQLLFKEDWRRESHRCHPGAIRGLEGWVNFLGIQQPLGSWRIQRHFSGEDPKKMDGARVWNRHMVWEESVNSWIYRVYMVHRHIKWVNWVNITISISISISISTSISLYIYIHIHLNGATPVGGLGLGFGERPVICRNHWDVLGKNPTDLHRPPGVFELQ